MALSSPPLFRAAIRGVARGEASKRGANWRIVAFVGIPLTTCPRSLTLNQRQNTPNTCAISAPPKTVLQASPQEETTIRAAVRAADLTLLGASSVVASDAHVAGLVDLLSDPVVSGPIYDLPRPITPETVGAWADEARRLQGSGDAVLVVTLDEDGGVAGYSRFTVWPERATAEIAGARRADQQNSGGGASGAARSFNWMFETLGVRLIGVTAALDYPRSARVIEAAGFAPMGERESRRPDGAVRPSRYWEMTREVWRGRL